MPGLFEKCRIRGAIKQISGSPSTGSDVRVQRGWRSVGAGGAYPIQDWLVPTIGDGGIPIAKEVFARLELQHCVDCPKRAFSIITDASNLYPLGQLM